MAAYYGDSSALAKRYVRETGSAWVTSLADPSTGHIVLTALITGAEVVTALFRRVRTGSVSANVARQAVTAFRSHLHDRAYEVVGITDAVLERAMDLAERHGLRGYDAVQLASALTAQDGLTANAAGSLTFLSADNDLNAAAAAEGLAVDNPNDRA